MTTFEIRMAGFINKGAAMMLIAATQEIRRRFPDARIAVPGHHWVPFEDRARFGLWCRPEFRKKGIDLGRAVEFLPSALRKQYGFVSGQEIDVVFDAAGFAYSDQWGPHHAQTLAKAAAAWRKAGKKLVLLPQAFGPFENPALRDAMREVADNAALIFARERQSYDYLVQAVGARDSIHIGPDFTNILKPVPYTGFRKGDGHVALVPNARMLDRTDATVSGNYEGFFIEAARLLQGAGLKPFLLLHEAKEDQSVAARINAGLEQPLDIIVADDALKAKGLIAESDAMVGSRFHALVSALSQAVPVVGTGWSHKYRELFADYDYPDGLARIDGDPASVAATLAPLLDSRARAAISERLEAASRRLKEDVSGMWDEVFRVIA